MIYYRTNDACYFQIDDTDTENVVVVSVCINEGMERIQISNSETVIPDGAKYSSVEFFLYHYRNTLYKISQKISN